MYITFTVIDLSYVRKRVAHLLFFLIMDDGDGDDDVDGGSSMVTMMIERNEMLCCCNLNKRTITNELNRLARVFHVSLFRMMIASFDLVVLLLFFFFFFLFLPKNI